MSLLTFPQRHPQALHPTGFAALTVRCAEAGIVIEREAAGPAERLAFTTAGGRRVVFNRPEAILQWLQARKAAADAT